MEVLLSCSFSHRGACERTELLHSPLLPYSETKSFQDIVNVLTLCPLLCSRGNNEY